jgi:hypothetical protein
MIERFAKKFEVRGLSECWPWNGAQSRWGYGLAYNFNRRHQNAHRVMWQLENGEIPHGLCVLHSCDNRLCVNPNHLFLGTHLDNARDRDQKGRANWKSPPRFEGEKHPCAKLTDDQAKQIRVAVGKQRDMAKQFGVCQRTICKIKTNKGWNHLFP